MKPIQQIRMGGPELPPEQHGDCFRACVCSILELPIDTLDSPSPTLPYEQWEVRWGAQLAPLGYWMLGLDLDGIDLCWWWLSPGYWIASVASQNLRDGIHAVVMLGDKLAHDPSPRRPYESVELSAVYEARVLVPLDPAAPRRPAPVAGGAP